MPISRCWKWLLEVIQFVFPPPPPPPSSSSSPSPPSVELCNDILFEIFLRVPPEVLPRLTCLNKESFAMITSPLFQRTYWTQKLCLPRLYAIVYYQRRLTNRIGFALMIKECDQRLDNSELHKYRQVPHFRFPSSSYNRLLQWADSMLQCYQIGDGARIKKRSSKCSTNAMADCSYV